MRDLRPKGSILTYPVVGIVRNVSESGSKAPCSHFCSTLGEFTWTRCVQGTSFLPPLAAGFWSPTPPFDGRYLRPDVVHTTNASYQPALPGADTGHQQALKMLDDAMHERDRELESLRRELAQVRYVEAYHRLALIICGSSSKSSSSPQPNAIICAHRHFTQRSRMSYCVERAVMTRVPPNQSSRA